MIQISETAQTYFRKLIEREDIDGLGVRLSAQNPGTNRADVRLEFAEPGEPVSYTHLDVYKRQVAGRSISSKSNSGCAASVSSTSSSASSDSIPVSLP